VSECLPVESGVPQGSILGPLLFTLFINGLPNALDHGKILLYADDTVILHSSETVTEVEDILSAEMMCVQRWLTANKLILHMGKTELVIFGTAKRLSNNTDIDINISINGQLILRKKVVKYFLIVHYRGKIMYLLFQKKREKELVC
jgi:hypothetical protein